jgi:cation:H+ antiporter
MTALLFVLGLAALFAGGNWLVRGAVAIALAFRIPSFVVGATVVGFGTSTPELLVSVQAALGGAPGVAIGNVVGSNTANILLILGLTALFGAIAAPWRNLRGDLVWMLAAALAVLPVMWDGHVGRVDGALLVAGIFAYLVQSLRRGGTDELPLPVQDPPWRAALFVIVGLVLLMVGARLLVDSATIIARAIGVSEAVIGLTIVAIGTSLPELAASIAAALKGQRDMALGNIVGSNIFNILAILGITALITPIPVEPRFLAIDVPVMIAVTLTLIGLTVWRGAIARSGGAALLLAYGLYVVALTMG